MLERYGLKKSKNGSAAHLMGIVNVTPDSFSDGGEFCNKNNAISHGLRLLDEGADILDIGGESTRPGAQVIDPEDEINRVIPVIRGLRQYAPQISIDTRNAATMRAALDAGATIINDISGLRHDPESLTVASDAQVPVILMHMLGTPQTMQNNPQYNNVIKDIRAFFKDRIQACETAGIDKKSLILDPGIGFGKTLAHNLLILRNISAFNDIGCAVLLGASRKSFIAKLGQDEPADERLPGSLAAALWGVQNGVQILRVHDVKETHQALRVLHAIQSA